MFKKNRNNYLHFDLLKKLNKLFFYKLKNFLIFFEYIINNPK